jgi:DNA repair photolyase
MGFDKKRTGTGTKEWSEASCNICLGCQNDCLYCYAASNAATRFKTKPRDQWHIEEFTKKAKAMKSFPAGKGVVMFPTTHDITPFNVDEYIRVAKLILEKGNKLLIVSKPRLECIEKMILELSRFRGQILFRFTIGSRWGHDIKFWEPGASSPKERIACLQVCRAWEFNTSVSIEPMLSGVSTTSDVVEAVNRNVTDTIWIGKMNKPRLRVDMTKPENQKAVETIEKLQSDDEIVELCRILKDNPKIRWKDSIKAVIARFPELR